MSEITGSFSLAPAKSKNAIARFRPAFLVLTPLFAILFQVYVPRFLVYLGYLEFPLLVTIYFAIMRRQEIPGLLYGASIGLLQDSLADAPKPIGMFGIVKTLVGYFAASVSTKVDTESHLPRLVLVFVFFCFHQFFYWMLSSALLGDKAYLDPMQTLVFAALNALVAVPLYQLLDTLKG